MDADGIRDVLREVFGSRNTPTVVNGWMQIKCPLAPWTHERGADKNASAGISINDTGTSVFNCFTCKNTSPFHGMLRKYAEFSGEDLDDLIEEIEDEAYLGPTELPEWGAGKGVQIAAQEPLDKDIYLDLYESAAGHPYVVSRGISDETCELLGLMVDPCDPADGEERILFPVFGPDGELYGLTGRATSKTAKLKVRDYHGFRKALNLLGIHLIAQEKPDKVLIVEGLFDYANCWEQGYPAVAVMHSTLTPQQAEILRGTPGAKYLFYDNDKAGDDGAAIAADLLAPYGPTLHVKYPRIWIDNPGEPEGGHYVKDPGELLAEEIEEMTRKAVIV